MGVGALVVACASSVGSASIDGQVSGVSLSPSSATFVDITNEIVISSNGGFCSDLIGETKRKNTQSLAISLESVPQVGTFTITASFSTFDDTCNSPIATTSTAGTVTITSVDQSGSLNISGAINSVTGTFDVTFGSDHVTGSFTAETCSPSSIASVTACH